MADTQRDVIEVLSHDHREVEEMFDRYEKSSSLEEHKEILADIAIELIRHSVAEEEYLYPAARKVLPDGDSLADEEISEHSTVEKLLDQLEDMEPGDDKFGQLMSKLMASVREHVQGEEGELFPKMQQACDTEELVKLGKQIETAKKVAPTRPHPLAPDHPPFNKMLAPGTGLVDRLRDFVTGRGR